MVRGDREKGTHGRGKQQWEVEKNDGGQRSWPPRALHQECLQLPVTTTTRVFVLQHPSRIQVI